MIVYLLTNTVNGKRYVGQTIGALRDRWVKHVSTARLSTDTVIAKAIRKYGPESFTVSVLATAKTLEELNRIECEQIALLGTVVPGGYNLCTGGRNHRPHPLTLEKCRLASLGNKYTLGYRATAETRKLLSEMRRGKVRGPHKPETRAKIALRAIGRPSGMKGRHHSAESLLLISRTKRKALPSEEIRSMHSGGMSCTQIAKHFGVSGGTICQRVREMGLTMATGSPKGVYSDHLRQLNEAKRKVAS